MRTLQAKGDMIGSTITYAAVVVAESIFIYLYTTVQPYQDYDAYWKKIIMANPLTLDGLLQQKPVSSP